MTGKKRGRPAGCATVNVSDVQRQKSKNKKK
jgi:hypothetical protein